MNSDHFRIFLACPLPTWRQAIQKMLVEDRLLLTTQYWREYRTMEHLRLRIQHGGKLHTQHHRLTAVEKAFNRRLPRKRMAIEHVNRLIKDFQDYVRSLPQSPKEAMTTNEPHPCHQK